MEALSWTLNNLITTHTTILYLIHVFPEIKHIPHPLGVGMVPRNQVSAEQVESYMAQERAKRRLLLHKFIHSCSISKVKVDTILIESDFVAKAILDLIPILQITNLVIGANKSHLRKLRSRKLGKCSVADEIMQNVPQSCNVRIICEGKEVNDQMMSSPSPQNQIITTTSANIINTKENNDSVLCICFKPKFK
ncbi:U-box domain-containing protein 35-like [Cicer arietinum]|uniref:U-box domain-containing protein 35-like n=1 Tax=Cicer arietinum TaxID=3827 RepID=A0A1S2YNT6_CICAR|nr:U-box domain-containing protein 35-like [Cicer arietinum]